MFENDSSDPDTPKPEKIKKVIYQIMFLGSHHSEKTEFLRQILRKKPTFVIGNSNQPSHVKTTLKVASPFSSMGDILVDPKGVAKLLDALIVHKASGPDGLNARVLKECSNEISLILALIYNEPLARGCTR